VYFPRDFLYRSKFSLIREPMIDVVKCVKAMEFIHLKCIKDDAIRALRSRILSNRELERDELQSS